MARVDIETFGGMLPRVSSRLLPAGKSEYSNNCNFNSGDLESWRDTTPADDQGGDLVLSVRPRSLYLYNDENWFSWNTDVDAIGSPVARDVFDRVYFTGDGAPKVTSNQISRGNGVREPVASFDLGVPAPIAPTATVTFEGSDTSGDLADDQARAYVLTYVTAYGEEGVPSPASNIVLLKSDDGIVSLDITGLVVNRSNIASVNVYRSATTGNNSEFFFVAQIPLSQTTFVDEVASVNLGEELDTYDLDAPPVDLKGLVLGTNGMAAGFVKNEFMVCEPYLPYAWPTKYSLTTEHDIVAIQPTSTGFVIGTKGNPYIVSGVAPDSLSQDRIDIAQACVSKRSMVDMGQVVIYASPDGLVSASESGAKLMTGELFDKRTWAAYMPETIHAYCHEEKYIGFYGDVNDNGLGVGGFVFDTMTGNFEPISIYAQGGYTDLRQDTLSLIINDTLHEWEGSSEYLPKVYRTGAMQMGSMSYTAMKVWSDDVTKVGIKLIVDGVYRYSKESLTRSSFRLPVMRGREWQVEITGDAIVERVTLATSMREL